MRLAFLVVLAFVGHASARSEMGPPAKVHIVTGKVCSIETLTIANKYAT